MKQKIEFIQEIIKTLKNERGRIELLKKKIDSNILNPPSDKLGDTRLDDVGGVWNSLHEATGYLHEADFYLKQAIQEIEKDCSDIEL